jgi:uncharacterized protein YodC (DUF2158 family)
LLIANCQLPIGSFRIGPIVNRQSTILNPKAPQRQSTNDYGERSSQFWFREVVVMEDFEVGHVVQLRTGGPKMTVHSLDSDNDVLCQWFEGREMHEENFPNEVVKKC